MAFRIGMKVVCIAAAPSSNGYDDEIQPQIGGVYTIRWLGDCDCGCGQIACLLVEITNRPRDYREGTSEMSFQINRFRPAVDLGWARALVQEVFDGNKRDLSADHELDRRKKVKAGGRA